MKNKSQLRIVFNEWDVPMYKSPFSSSGDDERVVMCETAQPNTGNHKYFQGVFEYENDGIQGFYHLINAKKGFIVLKKNKYKSKRSASQYIRLMVDHYTQVGLKIIEPEIIFTDTMYSPDKKVTSLFRKYPTIMFMLTPKICEALMVSAEIANLHMWLNDKIAFTRLCKSVGVSVPEYIEDIGVSTYLIHKTLGKNVLIKPRSLSGGEMITLANGDLRQQLKVIEKEGYYKNEFFIQKFIKKHNPSFGTIVFIPKKGKVKILQSCLQIFGSKDSFEYKGSEWLPEYQKMPKSYNDQILKISEEYQRQGFEGQAGFDTVSGIYSPVLVDPSPRWTGQTSVYVIRKALEKIDTKVTRILKIGSLHPSFPLLSEKGRKWLEIVQYNHKTNKGLVYIKPTNPETVAFINMSDSEIKSVIKSRYIN